MIGLGQLKTLFVVVVVVDVVVDVGRLSVSTELETDVIVVFLEKSRLDRTAMKLSFDVDEIAGPMIGSSLVVVSGSDMLSSG